MSSPPVPPAYSATAKALHWTIVLLVAIQFVISWLMPDIGRDTKLSRIITLHFSFGLLIVAVMAIRFAYRLTHPVPLDPNASPAWERKLATATHRLFYLILIVVPFLGWASASSHNLPVTFFGLFTMPALVAPHTRWANTAGDIHTWTMWTLLGIVVLHAAAAIYHEAARHDGTLKRMVPTAR